MLRSKTLSNHKQKIANFVLLRVRQMGGEKWRIRKSKQRREVFKLSHV